MINPIICPQCFQPNESVRVGCWKCLTPLSRVPVEKDFLRFFHLEASWTQNEAKLAFRRMARIYHPDHNPMNREADAYFKFINRGYELLCRQPPPPEPTTQKAESAPTPEPEPEEDPMGGELQEKLKKLIYSAREKPPEKKKSILEKLNHWLHKFLRP